MVEFDRGYQGKRVLGAVILVAVGIGASLGFVIGTSAKIRPISAFGVVLFRTTPLGMSLYGALAATALLTVIFAIVEFLSRFDTEKV